LTYSAFKGFNWKDSVGVVVFATHITGSFFAHEACLEEDPLASIENAPEGLA
jgi:hypothetical protein